MLLLQMYTELYEWGGEYHIWINEKTCIICFLLMGEENI